MCLRLETSNSPSRGWKARIPRVVGTRMARVMECSATSPRITSGSKGPPWMMPVEPMNRHWFSAMLSPAAWNIGTAMRKTSSWISRASIDWAAYILKYRACEASTPLGRPVVPEV